jgi:CRISPR-associated endonuclease Csn1
MEKTLGLDLGTNSIGWAIIQREDNAQKKLIDKGTNIFQEGVARNKGNEIPSVQERTRARGSRRQYFRRRLRKIELLKVLISENLCPAIPDSLLKQWKERKIYPLVDDFIKWQRTDDNIGKNPYYDRYLSLTQKLDLTKKENRYILGRAFYHINQRRGFLSNRKNTSDDENENGEVQKGISDLESQVRASGCTYIGEYFYLLYKKGEKIRNHYTSRKEQYLKEFNAICDRQEISDDLKKRLFRAIFFQRDLKSQKSLVGKCTFEPKKPRCPISHPAYEEFRMRQFVNSIKIKSLDDDDFRQLNKEEKEVACSVFIRKTDFTFESIAKKLVGKGNYSCRGDYEEKPYAFNYSKDKSVSSCPVTTAIIAALGNNCNINNWKEELSSQYLKASNKTVEQCVNDVWHALFSFNDEEKLSNWLEQNLQLSHENAITLAKTKLKSSYASLSLKAINKIIPYLRNGITYDKAVFFANIKATLPDTIRNDAKVISEIENNISVIINDFSSNPINRRSSLEKEISDYLIGVADGVKVERLYHPSMIETFPKQRPHTNGIYMLGSPRTGSFKNPMAMRSLFRLRALINELLREKEINPDTRINIEFSRELNDANTRKAIEEFQSLREKNRKRIVEELSKYESNPSEEDILKYQLWEEQNHKCLYTGKEIRIRDLIGRNSRFDIEHTIPVSRGGDNSQMNNTLCDSYFNRDIKKTKIPQELANIKDILDRIDQLDWKEKINKLKKDKEIQKAKSRNATTKDAKDQALEKMHLDKLELDYWQGKLSRFNIKEINDGFRNSQGVDIGIINRIGKQYLESVFKKVYTVKGETTAYFRKLWGLQNEYEKKSRDNYAHHCIDAITIACIGKNEYDEWARYKKDYDEYLFYKGAKPSFKKPWPTFTEDVLAVQNSLLVVHNTPDNMPKQSKKKLRIRGKIQRNSNNKVMLCQGDTARAQLNKETFYGAIKQRESIKYVVRKSLDTLEVKDISNIVDDVVRHKVESAISNAGNIKDAIASGIWMNEERNIPIKKVRIFTNIANPVHLKRQRDTSSKEYKTDYLVTNDTNYAMAIYGEDERKFLLKSSLLAAKYFNGKTDEEQLFPSFYQNLPLISILKIGTMVLLYENRPEEIYNATESELTSRLYKVKGLSRLIVQKKYEYGSIILIHNQEARKDKEIKAISGAWKIGDKRTNISMLHTQFNALVEGKDFIISETGKITFINKIIDD